ncbi:hypothetical protein CB1_082350002 [Camelus ferus]|nr:hypothetical protein CB1_082350002 [Camelus ferus]
MSAAGTLTVMESFLTLHSGPELQNCDETHTQGDIKDSDGLRVEVLPQALGGELRGSCKLLWPSGAQVAGQHCAANGNLAHSLLRLSQLQQRDEWMERLKLLEAKVAVLTATKRAMPLTPVAPKDPTLIWGSPAAQGSPGDGRFQRKCESLTVPGDD